MFYSGWRDRQEPDGTGISLDTTPWWRPELRRFVATRVPAAGWLFGHYGHPGKGTSALSGGSVPEECYVAGEWEGEVGDDMKTPARNTSDLAQNPLVDVARVLSDIARSLEAEPDLHHTAGGIAATVTDTVSGAEDAVVSLCEGESLRTVAATSDLVEQVNNLEYELNEGPCLDALHMRRTYRIDDMSHERRWPRFAAAAQAHGIQSMLGYRLFTSGRTLGALDLYSTQPSAFDANAEIVGELFAAHAAIALLGSTQHSEWQAALNSQDILGMAKGILMNRDGLTDDLALNMLVSASQDAAVKVHDVARWLVVRTNHTARGPHKSRV